MRAGSSSGTRSSNVSPPQAPNRPGMAIRYDTVDDGGAFCKVVLEEPGDVIQFAREACADPKKWDLFEAPMLQRLLMIFQERVEEARALARQVEYQRGVDHGRSQGVAMESGRQREMTVAAASWSGRSSRPTCARSRRPRRQASRTSSAG